MGLIQQERYSQLMRVAFKHKVPLPPVPLGHFGCNIHEPRYVMPTESMWDAWILAAEETLEAFGVEVE